MSPLDFLNYLWRGKPDDLFVLIWCRQGKVSHWFRDVQKAAAFIEKGFGTDVYAGVGLSPSDQGEHRRCSSEEVAGITGLWADFDLRSAAHSKKALPASIEEALTIIPPRLPPTIIIATGNGVHVWWLFDKPWIFSSGEERNEASKLSARFQTLLQYNASQKGWAFERLSDLARVLRIPGTVNAKDPANPKDVEVYSTEGRRYRAPEIREYLDGLAIPDADAQEQICKQLEQRFADSPFSVNLNASIPDELLSGWLKRDGRFRKTWNRERDDMPDQSGSGYDLALACFGVRSGLSDQQIVDLIVHHRRNHGDAQRRRADYFQRTISRARKTDSLAIAGATGTHSDQDEAVNAVQAGHNGDAIQKAQLCVHLSLVLGIRILRFLKVPGSEPVYLMELDDGRIEFDIARLTTKRSFKLAIAAKTNRILPNFGSQRWQELTQLMLDACTVLESTDDLHLEGAARVRIQQYLTDSPIVPNAESATRHDILKPLIWKGQMTVHTADFQTHLSQTAKQNYSVQRIAAMLTAIGAKTVRVRGGAFGDQSRWGLPIEEFDPKDYVSSHLEDSGHVA